MVGLRRSNLWGHEEVLWFLRCSRRRVFELSSRSTTQCAKQHLVSQRRTFHSPQSLPTRSAISTGLRNVQARFIVTATKYRNLFGVRLNCSSTLRDGLSVRATNPVSTFGFRSKGYVAEAVAKSPFESNILRILRNEIEYQSEYAPPEQPATKFNSFTVEDRSGEQSIRMNRKFGDRENVKIEATMFDGYEQVPMLGDDSPRVNVRFHISLLVDISKGDDGNELEFICSAWPDCLDVEKVYILRRGHMPARPYIGPDFRNLNANIQEKFREYLDARGVNNELSAFLHGYMMNKDRIELLRWLGNLKSFVEK